MGVPEIDFDQAAAAPPFSLSPLMVPAASKKEMSRTELLKTPDLTSPSSLKEWHNMWGKGADVTMQAKDLVSCKRRCLFTFKNIGPHALEACNSGCTLYSKQKVVPEGQRCISGSNHCNNLLRRASETCSKSCASLIIPPEKNTAEMKVIYKMYKKAKKAKKFDVSKFDKNHKGKKVAKKKAAPKKKGPKAKLKAAKKKLAKAAKATAKESVTRVEIANFAGHFCRQGCKLGAANICYQGSGECLNTPEFQTKWPKVGSCTKKSNACSADGTPTCSATKCIQTREQCKAACTSWRTKSGAGIESICRGDCDHGVKDMKVINKAFGKKKSSTPSPTPSPTPSAKKKAMFEVEEELVQFTQFPAWVETEADMEKYFKQQKTKVTRKDSGNGGVNPRTGRKFKPPKEKVDDEELVQVVNVYEDGKWKKKAEDQELVQFTQFPDWVETEEDMEKFLKQQKTKVTRRDTGNGGVNSRTGRKFDPNTGKD